MLRPQRDRRSARSIATATTTAARKAMATGPTLWLIALRMENEMYPPWNGRSTRDTPCRAM